MRILEMNELNKQLHLKELIFKLGLNVNPYLIEHFEIFSSERSYTWIISGNPCTPELISS
jgi:hypothetical protein